MILDDQVVSVQWYDVGHLAALAHVHSICFPGEGWRPADFQRFVDRPGQVARAIVTEDGRVIGTLLYRNTPDAVRLARVAVLPKYRRRRVASFAVGLLTGENSPIRKTVVTARVREHNVAGQRLLLGMSFRYTGTTRGFYPDAPVPVELEGQVQELTASEDAYHFRLDKPGVGRQHRLLRQKVAVL